jgi:hypothetical protein
MMKTLQEALWTQFGASIDMLENAISACPQELLQSNKRVFYITYHTLIFLDYYMTIPPKNFSSPLTFTLKEPGEIPEEALDDIVPDRFYTKQELLDYLQACRKKCYYLIADLTEEKLEQRFMEAPAQGTMNYSTMEILLYNMRHVQHHAAQLNMILRSAINHAPQWVGRAKDR